jgi:hypothetical protein
LEKIQTRWFNIPRHGRKRQKILIFNYVFMISLINWIVDENDVTEYQERLNGKYEIEWE